MNHYIIIYSTKIDVANHYGVIRITDLFTKNNDKLYTKIALKCQIVKILL
jgi:hypothetical protein